MRLFHFWWITIRCGVFGDDWEDAKFYAQQVVYGWRSE